MTIAKADDLITCPLTVGGASERSDLSIVCMGITRFPTGGKAGIVLLFSLCKASQQQFKRSYGNFSAQQVEEDATPCNDSGMNGSLNRTKAGICDIYIKASQRQNLILT
jgi:hypothetical protein